MIPMSGAGPLGAPLAATGLPTAAPVHPAMGVPAPVGIAPPTRIPEPVAPNPGRSMRFGIPNVYDRSNVSNWRNEL